MAVTLKDIAERVGKSVPTVSRALAGFEDISLETRQKVHRVAEELGYEPNVTARKLQRQRTDAIALVLPPSRDLSVDDPFFGALLTGIVEETALAGFELHLSMLTTTDVAGLYRRLIRSRTVDGFLLVRMQRQDQRITVLREYEVPFVAFGRMEAENDFPFVDQDDVLGMRLLVDHLVSLGHRRLALISEPLQNTKAFNRMTGFRDALLAHNLAFDPDLLIETRYRQQSGRLGALQLLDLAQPPTAIATGNDLLALGALRAVNERGLIVGRDVSVTGIDNVELSQLANPPLTTLNHSARQTGKLVASMLIDLIHGRTVPQAQVLLEPTLIVRKSTGPPP